MEIGESNVSREPTKTDIFPCRTVFDIETLLITDSTRETIDEIV